MIKLNKEKDKIAIIAPASAVRSGAGDMQLKKSFEELQYTISLFEQHGFKCKAQDNIFINNELDYFASPAEERSAQLKMAIEDPDVKIISCFRGGYGCSEIVFDCLDIKRPQDKILIGFSDITAMHLLFNQKFKVPSIHGLVSRRYQEMLPEIISILSGDELSYEVYPTNEKSGNIYAIEGEVAGGNLSIICSMIGTPLAPDYSGKIVLLEDTSEDGYRVHRNLMHLKNARILDNVRALVLADFTDSDKYLDQSIQHFIANHALDIPVFTASGIGHGDVNRPIVLGTNTRIKDGVMKVSSAFELI